MSDLKNDVAATMSEPYPYNLLCEIFGYEDTAEKIEPKHDIPADFYGSMEYMLATLSPRERDILHLRYVHHMTLPDIAAKYNVTRERIRQIEAKAIRKLRHPTRLRYITTGIQNIIHQERESGYRMGLADGRADSAAEAPRKDDEGGRISSCKIEDLNLSVRTFNCLKRAGYDTVADIIAADHDKLMKIRNFGICCLYELCDKLTELGLHVGRLKYGKG